MTEYIVLVGKEHYNPLGIIRTLGESGIKPIAVIVEGPNKFVGQSKYVKKTHYVPDIRTAISLILDTYACKECKSFILTGDDVSVQALDDNYDILNKYFYFYNAGSPNRISHYMNKDTMINLAEKHGINVAKTWKVKVGEIPNDIEYPVMTKALNSFGNEWKDIVYICKNDDELNKAYSKIQSPYILLQKYIDKVDEVSFDGFSVNRGSDVLILTEAHQVYNIPDKYSPYWTIKNCKNDDMVSKIKSIIAEIKLEGIFEFEFIIDKDNKYWFLEINFRNTALGYSTTVAGMPQVIYWCESMSRGNITKNYIKSVPDDLTAMAECFDYDARVKTGIISKREWKKQYNASQCKLYRGRHDIIPFLRFLWYKYTKMNRI